MRRAVRGARPLAGWRSGGSGHGTRTCGAHDGGSSPMGWRTSRPRRGSSRGMRYRHRRRSESQEGSHRRVDRGVDRECVVRSGARPTQRWEPRQQCGVDRGGARMTSPPWTSRTAAASIAGARARNPRRAAMSTVPSVTCSSATTTRSCWSTTASLTLLEPGFTVSTFTRARLTSATPRSRVDQCRVHGYRRSPGGSAGCTPR